MCSVRWRGTACVCVFLLWVRVAHMCVGTVASVAQGTSWGAAITQDFCPDLCCVSLFYYIWSVASLERRGAWTRNRAPPGLEPASRVYGQTRSGSPTANRQSAPAPQPCGHTHAHTCTHTVARTSVHMHTHTQVCGAACKHRTGYSRADQRRN